MPPGSTRTTQNRTALTAARDTAQARLVRDVTDGVNIIGVTPHVARQVEVVNGLSFAITLLTDENVMGDSVSNRREALRVLRIAEQTAAMTHADGFSEGLNQARVVIAGLLEKAAPPVPRRPSPRPIL